MKKSLNGNFSSLLFFFLPSIIDNAKFISRLTFSVSFSLSSCVCVCLSLSYHTFIMVIYFPMWCNKWWYQISFIYFHSLSSSLSLSLHPHLYIILFIFTIRHDVCVCICRCHALHYMFDSLSKIRCWCLRIMICMEFFLFLLFIFILFSFFIVILAMIYRLHRTFVTCVVYSFLENESLNLIDFEENEV